MAKNKHVPLFCSIGISEFVMSGKAFKNPVHLASPAAFIGCLLF